MKLSTRTSLNFLSIALFTFLFALIAFYYTLRTQVDRYINNELLKAKEAFFQKPDSHSIDAGFYIGACQVMPIKSVSTLLDTAVRFQDTLIFHSQVGKFLPYRQMKFITSTKENALEIRIIRPLEETDQLIVNIFLLMTLLVIVLIIALLITNKYSSHQIWKNFYKTLDKLNRFDLNAQGDLDLPITDIQEFDDLKSVLMRMSKRIAGDYLKMKEYTENASHEIQTPLAIINAKLELLLQSKNLTEKDYKLIADSYDASNRLARLNKTLILLTRIENHQFPEIETVSPKNIIERHLENYEELIQSKELELVVAFEPNVTLKINPYLSDILFLNLIKNAVRHTLPRGSIEIRLTNQQFEIVNSGAPLKVEAEKLFHRFYKSSDSKKSLGLGLAIVKKITELFGIEILYFYQENKHHVMLKFPSEAINRDE
ncbi:MAG TPA: hypothetical protein DCG69_02670 [Bacteroidales bacterium]|nr:hypothetical protein [Bacteroidales bacterium]